MLFFVISGTKCAPGIEPSISGGSLWFSTEITATRYDVAIYRYYESGKWLCLDV